MSVKTFQNDVSVTGTIAGGNVFSSSLHAANNVPITSTTIMPVKGNPGHIVEHFLPFNMKIIKIYIEIDDTPTSEFDSWTTGTLQFTLYVDDVSSYTSDAYVKADFSAGSNGFYALVTETLDVNVDADEGVRWTVTSASLDTSGMEMGVQTIYVPRL